MQLLVLNAFIMFDVVFIFFLFLVGVSCLAYYLPSTRRSTADLDAGAPSAAAAATVPLACHYVTATGKFLSSPMDAV